MAHYIDADKLIAKIKELNLATKTYEEQVAFNNALAMVVEIIDSLQQEQTEVDLKKEIDACWQNWLSPSNQKDIEGVLPKTEFAMCARHFYELGFNARKEE